MASASVVVNGPSHLVTRQCSLNTKASRSFHSLYISSSSSETVTGRCLGIRIRAETMATEKLGIKIEKNPPESKLAQLGVRNWPK